MQLFLDSANIEQIKELNDILTISGVTTNPSIITSSSKEVDVILQELINILNDEQLLFVQVLRTDFEGIMEEAKAISKLRKKNIYVKIPVTYAGLKACKECKKLGIKTLATAIYSAEQAFMAAMNGADYLAPYVNRMDDYGNGIENVKDLIEMLQVHNMESKVLAASFKNVHQVHELMKAGIDAVTIPCDIAYSMVNHPGTKMAVGQFCMKWQKAYHRPCLFERK